MRNLRNTLLVTSLGLSLAAAPYAPAYAGVTKPSEPTVASVSSSTPKKGKVNITVNITLPASDGGSKLTGSKVSAGGKSCTMKKTKTSCTIKGIKFGKSLNVVASSKNKKGFGKKSAPYAFTAGAAASGSAGSCPVASNGWALLASEYGLTESEVTSISGSCTSASTLQGVRDSVAARAAVKYPGLAGKISGSVSGVTYISYYVAALEYGLEIIPGNLNKWNDPLMLTFLNSGFPADKNSLGLAIRNDDRFQYTNRAIKEATAFAHGLACAMGFQDACISKIAASAALTALGPLVK